SKQAQQAVSQVVLPRIAEPLLWPRPVASPDLLAAPNAIVSDLSPDFVSGMPAARLGGDLSPTVLPASSKLNRVSLERFHGDLIRVLRVVSALERIVDQLQIRAAVLAEPLLGERLRPALWTKHCRLKRLICSHCHSSARQRPVMFTLTIARLFDSG